MKTINKLTTGLCVLTALAITPAKAQLTGGITGGLSTGAVEIQHVDRGFTNVIEGRDIMGFEAGLFLKLKAGPVYLKPMAMYNHQYGDISYQGQTLAYRANKLGVPLMFGLNLVGPLCIEAGPVYNYVVSMTENYNANTLSLARNGLGYRAGLVLDFGPILLNASYEGMTYDSKSTGRTGFKEPYRLLFGAGIRFGGGRGDNIKATPAK